MDQVQVAVASMSDPIHAVLDRMLAQDVRAAVVDRNAEGFRLFMNYTLVYALAARVARCGDLVGGRHVERFEVAWVASNIENTAHLFGIAGPVADHATLTTRSELLAHEIRQTGKICVCEPYFDNTQPGTAVSTGSKCVSGDGGTYRCY